MKANQAPIGLKMTKKSFDEAIDSAEYGKCVEISTQSAKKW